jgi:RHS repeat-associated protein
MRPLVMRGEESVEPQTCQKTARLRHPAGFTYDAAGDLTADGVNTYSWNAEAHLKSAAGVTYTYDGDLRRVEKSSGTLYWYCATCGNVLAESDLSGNLTSEYAFFGDRRIARRDVSSGNVYYIFSDRLGSYRTLSDSSGNVQGESDYYPFGAERVISSTMTDNFRFAGMEWDSEDGLNHTLYRKYTPAQGRWESPDPVRGCVNFPQGQNLYAYVEDSPTNFTDPNGDQWPPAGCLNNAFVGRARAAYTADYSDSDCICNWDPVACCIMAGECGGGGGGGGDGGEGTTSTCTPVWPIRGWKSIFRGGNLCGKSDVPGYPESKEFPYFLWAFDCTGIGPNWQDCCRTAADQASKACEAEGGVSGGLMNNTMIPSQGTFYANCCSRKPITAPPPTFPSPGPKPPPRNPKPGS